MELQTIAKSKTIKMNNKNSKILHSIFFFLLISFCVSSCVQLSLEEKRNLTMIKVIDLIKINDTLALTKIIDTAYTYRVLGKESFFYSINKMHNKFANNQILNTISSNDINILNEPVGNSYEILLYTSENKSKFYRIIMRFIGNQYDKVYSFQSNYNNNSDILDAPPKSQFK